MKFKELELCSQKQTENKSAASKHTQTSMTATRKTSRAMAMQALSYKFTDLYTTVIGYCEVILQRLDEGHWLETEIAKIRRAALHAAELNQQLFALTEECRKENES